MGRRLYKTRYPQIVQGKILCIMNIFSIVFRFQNCHRYEILSAAADGMTAWGGRRNDELCGK